MLFYEDFSLTSKIFLLIYICFKSHSIENYTLRKNQNIFAQSVHVILYAFKIYFSCSLFAKCYPEKSYKETWRPDVAAMSGYLHPSTSAFLPPLQPPPIMASTSKAPDPLPPLPGPPPTFR